MARHKRGGNKGRGGNKNIRFPGPSRSAKKPSFLIAFEGMFLTQGLNVHSLQEKAKKGKTPEARLKLEISAKGAEFELHIQRLNRLKEIQRSGSFYGAEISPEQVSALVRAEEKAVSDAKTELEVLRKRAGLGFKT